MFIDTHCHINIMVKDTFDVPLTRNECLKAEGILEAAQAVNVKKMLCVGTSLIESINCVQLAAQYEVLFATVGIHPNDATLHWKKDLLEIQQLASQHEKNKIVAIGECGVDTHYPGYDLPRQQDVFRAHIELAIECGLALVVHTRNAHKETLSCLEEYKNYSLRGVIHCFSEDLTFAYRALAMGFVIGIGGTITYPKNKNLREVIHAVGLQHLVLETDAPFLPPQPIRGQKNSPAQIPTIAHALSSLLDTSLENIAMITTQNAERIFKLS